MSRLNGSGFARLSVDSALLDRKRGQPGVAAVSASVAAFSCTALSLYSSAHCPALPAWQQPDHDLQRVDEVGMFVDAPLQLANGDLFVECPQEGIDQSPHAFADGLDIGRAGELQDLEVKVTVYAAASSGSVAADLVKLSIGVSNS
nr:hypothetical protein [Ensifer sp. YR511]